MKNQTEKEIKEEVDRIEQELMDDPTIDELAKETIKEFRRWSRLFFLQARKLRKFIKRGY